MSPYVALGLLTMPLRESCQSDIRTTVIPIAITSVATKLILPGPYLGTKNPNKGIMVLIKLIDEIMEAKSVLLIFS